jgi:hypothetical protein
MRIKVHKSWKESIDKKPHPTFSRRDFLSRGLATSVATVAIPHALSMAMAKNAFGSAASCPPAVRTPGALAQIYRDGGPTVGAMFLNQQQVSIMSANMASRYGIVQTDIAQVGANWSLATSSPFAIGLMTAPAGYSQAAWNAVLMKTSLGGHYGAFNQDDGAGENSGLLGGASTFKPSVLGKDLRFGNTAALANWAQGIPSTGVSGSPTNLTPANVAKNFGISPAGNTTSALMTNAAVASESLSQLFLGLFGANRTNAQGAVSKATCGFYGDSVLADPTYGNSLFNPAAIAALNSGITLGSLTPAEQALLAAYYQSATGSLGGVFAQQGGCDYHGQSVQNTIAPSDYAAGRMVAMFVAACQIAGTKGAMIMLHNGQAIASGVVQATVGPNGVTTQGPSAQGDAGGAYNAGVILAYDPSSPPALSSTGTFNTTSGDVTAAPAVAASSDAVAGLYLTAIAHLGLSVSQAASLMQQGSPQNIMLIS